MVHKILHHGVPRSFIELCTECPNAQTPKRPNGANVEVNGANVEVNGANVEVNGVNVEVDSVNVELDGGVV